MKARHRWIGLYKSQVLVELVSRRHAQLLVVPARDEDLSEWRENWQSFTQVYGVEFDGDIVMED